MEAGTITTTEFALLGIVDSFVTPFGPGCWASNKYLARRIHKTVSNVQKMLKKLKTLTLLRVAYENVRGKVRRTLETDWSRAGMGRQRRGWNERVKDGTSSTRGVESIPPHKREEIQEEINYRSGGARDGGEEVTMSFGLSSPKQTPTEVTSKDQYRANKLKQAVTKKKAINRRWSLKTWTHQFHLLARDLNQDHARLDKVLDWFCSNLDDRYVPLAHSAKGFRDKFTRIEEAMKRRQGKSPVEVTETAKSLAQVVGNHRWPKGANGKLPELAQRSLDGYDGLVKAYTLLKQKITDDDLELPPGSIRRLERFSRFVDSSLGDRYDFVRRWMEAVYRQVKGWETWSGDVGWWAFHLRHEKFQQTGRDWAQAYSGDPQLWTLFASQLEGCTE